MTACQLRRPMNISIDAGGGFSRLDADGAPSTSGGQGNHAVTIGIGAKRAKNGEWMILGQNSWGTGWGMSGFFYYKRRHWEGQAWRDCYDVVAVGADPDDPMPALKG